MKITIIGASKGVGLRAAEIALEKKQEVTTLSRTKVKVSDHYVFNEILGDARKEEDIQKSIGDAEAIIICLGTGKNTKATTLFSDFAKSLIEINKKQEIKVPVIVLTGFGAGDSGRYNGFFEKIFFSLILKKIYRDKTEMEKIITTSNLNWIIVRPGLLTNKKLTKKYRIEIELTEGMKIKSISRYDVAHFLVKQAENPTMIGKYVSLTQG